MILLQRKLGKIEHFNADRRIVDDTIKKLFEYHNKIFLYGLLNAQSTELVFTYADEYFKGSFGYYLMDESDNDALQFYQYLRAAAVNAGYFLADEEPENSDISDKVNWILNSLEETNDKEHLWIFDRVDFISDKQVLEIFCRVLRYLPKNDYVILVSSAHAQDQIRTLLNESVLIGTGVGNLFHENIMRIMGPQKNHGFFDDYSKGTPGAQRWFEENAWNKLSGEEKYLLCIASVIKYISPKYCEKVLKLSRNKDPLLWLYGFGLLNYDGKIGDYNVPLFVKNYIRVYINLDEYFDSLEIANKSYEWFLNEGHLDAAFECLLFICLKDNTKDHCNNLLEFCERYMYEIVHMADLSMIKQCIVVFSQYHKWNESYELKEVTLYFKGLVALRTMNDYGLTVIEKLLSSLSQSYKKENDAHKFHRTANYLLNIYYQDRRYLMGEWLCFAESYMNDPLFYKMGPVVIYDYTANCPSVLAGTRNLVEWFANGEEKELEYKKRFGALIHPNQRPVFEIAKIDYLIETGREKEATELFRNDLTRIQSYDSVELIGAFAGAVSRLYQYGCLSSDVFRVEKLMKVHWGRRVFFKLLKNIKATYIYAGAYISSKYQLIQWLEEQRKEDIMIDSDNLFITYIKSKACLMFRQYERGRRGFEYLIGYYEKMGMKWAEIECRFGKAVCLYALFRSEESVAEACEAISMGMKYRYVKSFCSHGEEGLRLLGACLKTVSDDPKRAEYISALYKHAKKELKRCKFGGYEMDEQLTKTEQKVLDLISLGYSNLQIADTLMIKLPTAKTHVSNLYKKLGVKNRVEAIQKSRELGLII